MTFGGVAGDGPWSRGTAALVRLPQLARKIKKPQQLCHRLARPTQGEFPWETLDHFGPTRAFARYQSNLDVVATQYRDNGWLQPRTDAGGT